MSEEEDVAAELDRFRLLAKVFRAMPRKFAGVELEPLTAGRWDLLRERGNDFLFREDEEPDEEPETGAGAAATAEGSAEAAEQAQLDAEMMYGVCEFLWVHTAPVEDVLAADGEEPEVWRRKVKAFGMGAGMTELIEFIIGFHDRAREMAAALVEGVEGEEAEEPGKHGSRGKRKKKARRRTG